MSLNLTIGFVLGWLLTFVSNWFTRRAPLVPLDIMRTAYWGGIEYDCTKSMTDLGIQYTPIEATVREAMQDVKAKLGVEPRNSGFKMN